MKITLINDSNWGVHQVDVLPTSTYAELSKIVSNIWPIPKGDRYNFILMDAQGLTRSAFMKEKETVSDFISTHDPKILVACKTFAQRYDRSIGIDEFGAYTTTSLSDYDGYKKSNCCDGRVVFAATMLFLLLAASVGPAIYYTAINI